MSKKLIQAAAGAGGESVYVDDVFSTYLYAGTGASHAITNGIDLDGEGGMVWIKNRTSANWNVVEDTDRGATKTIYTNSTNAEATQAQHITSFNSNGFTAGTDNDTNASGEDYTSWTFRKQAGFFDVVTWTGNGTAGRTVSHNLGSKPAFIMIKILNSSSHGFFCYHESLGATKYLTLNTTNAANTGTGGWNDTEPTSTEFTLGSWSNVNGSSFNYVAYLFAHDDQSFGDNSDESIIKCGSYTGTGSYTNPPVIDLGFEPQFVIIKNASASGDWLIGDIMRGATSQIVGSAGEGKILKANLSNAETSYSGGYIPISPTATGFTMSIDGSEGNASGNTYIYIAIRRPMKTPESGTEVFSPNAVTSTGSNLDVTNNINMASGSLVISHRRDSTSNTQWFDNLRGPNKRLKSNSTDSEDTLTTSLVSWNMDGFTIGTQYGSTESQAFWSFKRATGFFDVVAYTGDGINGRDVIHNLKVLPEFVIIKERNSSTYWLSWHKDTNDYYLRLNDTNAAAAPSTFWNHTTYPVTSTSFPIGTHGFINGSGDSYICYLFATLAGVSKVGSYTGTAANLDVDCGFSAGARFILIKRTDSTGDWYVYDSERGIVAGNDPYLLLNSTAAEVTSTDYIDPLSSGFTVTSSAPAGLNASGGSYIFLAIS